MTPPAHAAAPAPRWASMVGQRTLGGSEAPVCSAGRGEGRGGAWPSDREAVHPEAVHASASSRRRADGPSHAPPPSRRRRWARRCASAAAPAARGQEGGEGWPTSADVGRRHVGPSGAGTELSTSTRLVHALPPQRRWRWAIGARRAGVCFCLRLVPSHAARVASARLWPRSPSRRLLTSRRPGRAGMPVPGETGWPTDRRGHGQPRPPDTQQRRVRRPRARVGR